MLIKLKEIGPADRLWRQKASQVIYALCRASYLQANQLKNGALRKRHMPYSVPESAQILVKCLDENDEQTAKEMFLNDYYISKIDGQK